MRSTVVATPDPPPVGIANPIHAEDGATGAGYQGALVAGVRTYGWVADAVQALVGPTWLEAGWADISLRRPLYASETVVIDIDLASDAASAGTEPGPPSTPGSAPMARWLVRAAVGGDRVVLDGEVGMGQAPWFEDIEPPPVGPALEPPRVRPTYTLDTVPYRVALRPLKAFVNGEAARRLATVDLGLEHSDLPEGRLHPWFLAARMAPLTRHNFTYGPTIHVRTQIQHLAPAQADQAIIIGAHIVQAYERKGHWYQILDGMVTGEGNRELARLRHTTIFRPRGTETPPPIVTES